MHTGHTAVDCSIVEVPAALAGEPANIRLSNARDLTHVPEEGNAAGGDMAQARKFFGSGLILLLTMLCSYHNDWTETRSICNDCGEDITGVADDHIRATGHSFHTKTVYHHDLVSEAWDEQVWVEAHDEVVGYKYTYYTETYCTECGEIISRVQN